MAIKSTVYGIGQSPSLVCAPPRVHEIPKKWGKNWYSKKIV